MEELTGFQRDLLCVLCGLDDPKGMTIQSELEEYYGGEVLHARVYQNLDSLEESGFVEKGERDSRTNYYTITPAGREEVEERIGWKRQYLDDSPVEVDA